MKNKTKLFIIGLFIPVVLVIYFLNNKQIDVHKLDAPIEGYGITLHQMNEEMIKSFIIEEQNDILKKKIKVSNSTNSKTNFTLAIYIDYEQVNFSVDGKSESKTYNFELAKQEDLMIPISLSIEELDNNTSHQLLIVVASGTNKHASIIKSSSDFYGVIARYNLRRSQSFDISNIEYILPNYYYDAEFSGILINQDFNKTNKFNYPPLSIKSKPGEKINLAVRIGGNTKDFTFWLTLNWKQTEMNEDKKPFINVKNKTGKTSFLNISIYAPVEKGNYELAGYLIANPWVELDDGFMRDIGSNTSYRFTLKVE